MTERPPPLAPSDDPSGGRALTRRLARVLPVALAVGLAIGIPLAILAGDWRPAIAVPLGLAALAGPVAAAIEDGRVQRRVEAGLGRSTQATLQEARAAVAGGDEDAARELVERALLRGATPARVARAIGDTRWDEERVRAIARRLGEGP
jgi:hypothetical protein